MFDEIGMFVETGNYIVLKANISIDWVYSGVNLRGALLLVMGSTCSSLTIAAVMCKLYFPANEKFKHNTNLIKYVLLLFPHVFWVVAKESWCAFYKQLRS